MGRRVGRRGLVLLALGLFLVPMSAASLAYACTGLATISTDPGAAVAGATVTVNARGFAPHDPSDARTSPAEIRMDSMTGPVIGTASPSSARSGGNFSVQITVPNVEAGDHVLIATQNDSSGKPSYGTPARTVFTVNPTPVAVAAAAPAPAPVVAPVVQAPDVVAAPSRAAASSGPSDLARAIARCSSKFDVKKAKTVAGKRRTLARRKACVTQARADN